MSKIRERDDFVVESLTFGVPLYGEQFFQNLERTGSENSRAKRRTDPTIEVDAGGDAGFVLLLESDRR